MSWFQYHEPNPSLEWRLPLPLNMSHNFGLTEHKDALKRGGHFGGKSMQNKAKYYIKKKPPMNKMNTMV